MKTNETARTFLSCYMTWTFLTVTYLYTVNMFCTTCRSSASLRFTTAKQYQDRD